MSEGSISLEIPTSANPSNAWNNSVLSQISKEQTDVDKQINIKGSAE